MCKHLAGEIGERNMQRYPQLNAAANSSRNHFRRPDCNRAGTPTKCSGRSLSQHRSGNSRRSSAKSLSSARTTIPSSVRPARMTTAAVSPRCSRWRVALPGNQSAQTLRFVAFVNEEPPYFQTEEMGSLVYASRCKARGDQISGMISLETIGYFSDAPHSQTYPVARSRRVLSDDWKLHRVRRECSVRARSLRAAIASFGSRRNFLPKAQRCPHSFPASVGPINGRSGNTVIPAS